MKKISINDLKSNIKEYLILDESNYSYEQIITSIPRIKKISKKYKVKVKIKELKNREINSLNDIAEAININDRRKRLSYIYDKICDYLDYDFLINNKCLFKDNKCISDRNKKYNKDCGCCRSKNGALCQYLKNGHCTIRNLGCKFFICPTLKKQSLSYKTNSFPLLKYFCNFREKIVLRYTVFVPKEEVIERILNYRW